MSLLEQNTRSNEWMNQLFPEPELEFDAGDNKEYEVEVFIDNAVYVKKAEKYLPGQYYLVS